LFNLAIVRTAAGDVAGAIELYEKYVELKPDDAGGHLNLGLLLVQRGDAIGGQREIEAAIALDPTISVAPPSIAPTASPEPAESPKETPSAS
jgi:Flp pilus assembly protein TadD